MNIGTIQDTTELILCHIAEADFSNAEKVEYFDKIQKAASVIQSVRDLACKFKVDFK